ncbi:MAG: ribosome small subunit-dependent GTPase A [Erysipelotrichaceae bacterium]|nr:ribosome small subunit-dependent GTPase A [Erysipelotrichaceae bacterium]
MKGQIIRIVSNQYGLLGENGDIIQAVAMGKLRLNEKPLVGDMVEYELIDGVWAMQRVLERKNRLIRPAIANVDQAMIVMSAVEPAFSAFLVDKLIFLISYENVEPVIVITKMDMVRADDEVYKYIEDYRKSGYKVIPVGHDISIEDVEECLKGKITVLTGQSGVGKSTLLNRLDPAYNAATQEISKARGRGKHTTRHVQLYPVAGGWLADTPGFSSLDFSRHDALTLARRLKDFEEAGQCRFLNCKHINEPDCAVKKGVEEGRISSIRYNDYKQIVAECNKRKEWE